jgi:hypothetical protein
MTSGDRVSWTYIHHLNSKSSTIITKHGTLIRFSCAIKNFRYVAGTIAIVHFDNNKHPSKVPTKELTLLTKR